MAFFHGGLTSCFGFLFSGMMEEEREKATATATIEDNKNKKKTMTSSIREDTRSPPSSHGDHHDVLSAPSQRSGSAPSRRSGHDGLSSDTPFIASSTKSLSPSPSSSSHTGGDDALPQCFELVVGKDNLQVKAQQQVSSKTTMKSTRTKRSVGMDEIPGGFSYEIEEDELGAFTLILTKHHFHETIKIVASDAQSRTNLLGDDSKCISEIDLEVQFLKEDASSLRFICTAKPDQILINGLYTGGKDCADHEWAYYYHSKDNLSDEGDGQLFQRYLKSRGIITGVTNLLIEWLGDIDRLETWDIID